MFGPYLLLSVWFVVCFFFHSGCKGVSFISPSAPPVMHLFHCHFLVILTSLYFFLFQLFVPCIIFSFVQFLVEIYFSSPRLYLNGQSVLVGSSNLAQIFKFVWDSEVICLLGVTELWDTRWPGYEDPHGSPWTLVQLRNSTRSSNGSPNCPW